MNKISQTIMESLDNGFTLYDFRGPWAKKKHKEIILKQINEKFKSHLLQSQIKVIEAVIAQLREISKRQFPRGERKWCIECAQRIAKDQISSLTETLEFLKNSL